MTLTASFTPPSAAYPDSAPGDTYFSSVKLLLHCDGVDGSTTFTDVAGHTVVVNGNAQIDTAQSQFGGASAYFDGAGDYLTITHATDFDLAANENFTAESWFRLETAPTTSMCIMCAASAAALRWGLYAVLIGAEIRLRGMSNAATYDGRTALQTGVWYHAALCRRDCTLSVYLNGYLECSAVSTSAYDSAYLHVGYEVPNAQYPFRGWVDDVRYTAGVARYTPVVPGVDARTATSSSSVGYGHTWDAQDRTLYPITPKWSNEVTVERYPVYAYTGGNYFDLARNGRIAGTLLEAGVPKTDTWVFLSYRLTAQVVAGTRTDAAGNFEFLNLYPNAKYLVSAYESRTNPPGYNVVSADYITPVLMAA